MTTPPCAADPELWFSPVPADRDLAKRICGTCLMRTGCLAGANKRGEVWGIYGGEDMEQREVARLTAEMAAGVLEVAEVHRPSRSAYVSGCGCDGCRAENTRWKAEYERRRAFRPVVVIEPETIDLQMDLLEGIA